MSEQNYSPRAKESWPAPSVHHAISAQVTLPGSKSLTNRELVLSALATSPTQLRKPLESRDSQLMIEALRKLGTQINRDENGNLLIIPATTDISLASVQIDCGLAGTVMRFVPPMAALTKGAITFDGDEAARRRPMKTTIESLRGLGISVEANESGALPFTVRSTGLISGGELTIDASASSQFVSGLLLAAARYEKGLTLQHSGEHLPSLPHIEMTIETLRARGVLVHQPDELTWVVEPGDISGGDIDIEPDLSNAGPFIAAALVLGGSVTIKDWPAKTTQVGKHFVDLLTQMGAAVSRTGNDLTFTGTGVIKGIEVDLGIGGELAPVIIALAVLAEGPSTITGIAHLRGHETDRLAALTAEINAIGGNATELPDGIQITPDKSLSGNTWHTYEDHRMATAGAIIGLRVPGIVIEDVSVVSKTMPEFVSLWTQLLEQKA
ncbi:MAG: 3-phosphoshikimate 1-carboxyvinyltransferase [Rhodoluna sp.]|nr:3-phosphoshikimate 1-carboxyvinyltransferase [Rhodoluna sp.]